ncbi:MAG TPA: 4'-phosphopantetheinyl transferase superfamily protein [Cyclobacteriaceae bacterium]|nr:4'-phosphopantetheinyl transferase superfamily protein [Cyclobacteriaceae bacterium]
MPLQKIVREGDQLWGLWKINEDEASLHRMVNEYEKIPESLTNTVKRLEFLAGRNLVKTLMTDRGLTFRGIIKDEFGKPYPADSSYQLSLSHSFPYVAASLHSGKSVGIDLEQPKAKLLRIAPRILNEEELTSAGSDLTKHCIIWCAKEVLIKVHGKKDLVFAKNLQIAPFSLDSTGQITGRIIVNNHQTIVPLYYEVDKDFIVVLNKPNAK